MSAAPFATLSPDRVLDAVEALGHRCNGRLLALNSYENRVYRVGIDEQDAVIAKFYRAGRWTDAAIAEEHAYALELAAAEIPVVAPIRDAGGRSLFHHGDARYALFPNRPGRAPELEHEQTLRWIGRFLGRIHAHGASQAFRHRATLSIDRLGVEPSRYLLAGGFFPGELRTVYASVVDAALAGITAAFARAGTLRFIRLHGDCHPGNILWTVRGPHFVDLDDCMSGPAIQDLWMLLAGEREEMGRQMSWVLEDYADYCDFNYAELLLIEALRTLRMIHYAAWLARRWEDPAFPLSFPWFNTQRYWQDHILSLREQLAAMNEPSLALAG
ncbi:MAG: serine/threonine protein kinase [Gammaproteobacteria bacterium]